MGERSAFFYGTLMAHEILYRVCYGESQVGRDPIKTLLASKLTIRPAILHDFCRHRVRGADYPGIIQQDGHSVLGTYVTGLTDGDIFRLDSFEGFEYTREKVEIQILTSDGKGGDNSADGRMVKTETYVYTYGEKNLEEKEWDYEEFRRAKLKNWTSASHEYAEVDAAVASLRETADGRGSVDGENCDEEEDGDEEIIRRAV